MDESKKPGILEEDYEPTDEEVAAAERIIDKHRRWAEKKLSSIGNNETTSVLDDPSHRERVLEHAHHIAGIYRDGLDTLEQGNQHLKAVLAKGVHESVQRAADNVIAEISRKSESLSLDLRILSEGIAAIEKNSSLNDAFMKSPKELERLVDQIKWFHGHKGREVSERLTNLRVAVDTIEFATAADRSDELTKVKRAMADIQKGVTQLRMLGFELGDVRAAVEDFIELRWQHDFKLTGRETSDDNTKEANRNNRALRGKRERLLAEDVWVTRFLNEFWYRYWRNTFEQSRFSEEHSATVEEAMAVIPTWLDDENEPSDTRYLCISAWSEVRKRREEEGNTVRKVRFRDAHALKALERLLHSTDSGVVEIEAATRKFWTRRRAEAAGMKIVPPRLRPIPPEGDHDAET